MNLNRESQNRPTCSGHLIFNKGAYPVGERYLNRYVQAIQYLN